MISVYVNFQFATIFYRISFCKGVFAIYTNLKMPFRASEKSAFSMKIFLETSLYKLYKKYWNYEENTSFHFKKTFFLKSYFLLSHFFKTLALKISAVNWCKKKYFYIYLCGNLQRTRTYTFFDNSLRNMGCRCLKILFRGSCCIYKSSWT